MSRLRWFFHIFGGAVMFASPLVAWRLAWRLTFKRGTQP